MVANRTQNAAARQFKLQKQKARLVVPGLLFTAVPRQDLLALLQLGVLPLGILGVFVLRV
jgi:hypothetical protein